MALYLNSEKEEAFRAFRRVLRKVRAVAVSLSVARPLDWCLSRPALTF